MDLIGGPEEATQQQAFSIALIVQHGSKQDASFIKGDKNSHSLSVSSDALCNQSICQASLSSWHNTVLKHTRVQLVFLFVSCKHLRKAMWKTNLLNVASLVQTTESEENPTIWFSSSSSSIRFDTFLRRQPP